MAAVSLLYHQSEHKYFVDFTLIGVNQIFDLPVNSALANNQAVNLINNHRGCEQHSEQQNEDQHTH
jgi:hypothetical protein